MHFPSLRWRIAFSYVALILAIMAGLILYLTGSVREAHVEDLRSQLMAETRLVGDAIEELSAYGQTPSRFDHLALRWSHLLNARVTIVSSTGEVLGESHEDRSEMENHLNRTEIKQALSTGEGTTIRFSRTLGYDMLYGAVAFRYRGQVVGAVRVALPLFQVDSYVETLRRSILIASAVASLLAILVAVFIAQRTVRPVLQLTKVVDQMATGNLGARLFPKSRDEIGHLTRSFNWMAEQLQEKLASLARERARLEAVLQHMADGVLITDPQGQVQLINPAAARLLGTTQSAALGRSFVQTVRSHHLVEAWQRCDEACVENVAEVEVERGTLFVRLIVTPLQDVGPSGRLVILQDLTQIRRLETVRRDFISNISHELRTPLASLKALVETLRDGALEDPPAAQRFLNGIENEVDALTQIVTELLELSRIESGMVPVRLEPTEVSSVVGPPVDRLSLQAERAGLNLKLKLDEPLPLVLADLDRAQQVVTNLVHNAIKFTASGGFVTVTAERTGSEVVIAVHDTGVGIPAQDVPRIFERFYKADRARSGGGTGLGLAIARHIVQAHGGRIWAKSIEGQGSTFFFTLRVADFVNDSITEH